MPEDNLQKPPIRKRPMARAPAKGKEKTKRSIFSPKEFNVFLSSNSSTLDADILERAFKAIEAGQDPPQGHKVSEKGITWRYITTPPIEGTRSHLGGFIFGQARRSKIRFFSWYDTAAQHVTYINDDTTSKSPTTEAASGDSPTDPSVVENTTAAANQVDSDEPSDEDWADITIEAAKMLGESLDTPEHHLAYVRKQIEAALRR